MDNLYNLLIINAVFALACLLFYIFTRNTKKGVVSAFFILVTPIVGPLCLFFAQLYNLIFYRKEQMELSLEELSLSDSRIDKVVDIDIEKETDKIPLSEAMLSTDRKNRRKVLLDVLKSPKDEVTLSVIKEAAKDEDTEVSHYAISYITAATTSFRTREEEAFKFLKEYPSVEARVKYIECLCEILSPKFFTEFEQEVYIVSLDEQIRLLRQEDTQAVTGIMLTQIVGLFDELDQQTKVLEYLSYAREIATKDLNATKLCLKYYFKHEDKQNFSQLLQEVKVSVLELDSEVLDWIRFYNTL